mmetsp:Transcript_18/g.67  ORF Transcript_18/g.67 Transcript_18/m.67 type:complete len:82 (-) Transcript_18:318-563(-)
MNGQAALHTVGERVCLQTNSPALGVSLIDMCLGTLTGKGKKDNGRTGRQSGRLSSAVRASWKLFATFSRGAPLFVSFLFFF